MNHFISKTLNGLLICGLGYVCWLSPGMFVVFAALGTAWAAFLWLARHKPVWAAGVLGLFDGLVGRRW